MLKFYNMVYRLWFINIYVHVYIFIYTHTHNNNTYIHIFICIHSYVCVHTFITFQILKDDTVKVLHSIRQQIWKTQQWSQDWKKAVFIPVPKKGNAKECSNYHKIALIPHASKVMLKILQAGLQQYVNCELSDVQAGFRKGRGTRDQIANIQDHRKIKRIPEKHLLLLHWLG